MVSSLFLLQTRDLVKLLTSPSLTRREDSLKMKSTDLSKRLRSTRSLMSREECRLSLRTTLNSMSTRYREPSRMRRSRKNSPRLRELLSTPSVTNFNSGYMLTRMLLRTSMRRRDRSSRLYTTQLLLRSLDNRDKVSQDRVRISLEVKDSQVLELKELNRIIREPILTILTEVNNFKKFIFYKISYLYLKTILCDKRLILE
jgi:hypothetical protein